MWLSGGGCGWNLLVWLVGVFLILYLQHAHNMIKNTYNSVRHYNNHYITVIYTYTGEHNYTQHFS